MTNHIELSATVPDEPPDGSVILDRARRAWQRQGPAWYMAGALPSLFTAAGAAKWPWLLFDCGPVIPLWTPSSTADEATAADTSCPNQPKCEHPSWIHDVSGDPEDPKPMCCADGCTCGQPEQRDAVLPRLAELAEQAGKTRTAEWLRTCATLPPEQWPPAPAYKGDVVPRAQLDDVDRALRDLRAQLGGIHAAARAGEDLGCVAYQHYAASVGGRSVEGDPLPTWEEQHRLRPGVATAWIAAAVAVAEVVLRGAVCGAHAAADAAADDPTEEAAREREQRAQAEARPHEDTAPRGGTGQVPR